MWHGKYRYASNICDRVLYIVNPNIRAEPENADDPTHVAAAERARLFKVGWFITPLTSGRYPTVMEPFTPQFTETESNEIRGAYDFLGINHYTTELAKPANVQGSGWEIDQATERYLLESWPESAAVWLRVVPWGFRKLLNWLKDTYGNPEIYITENGYPGFPDESLVDTIRINYYRDYINQMLKAVKKDNVRVTTYTAWSLIGNLDN